MSTRDSGVTPDPNFIRPPRGKNGGLSDKGRDPPYLTADEAAFVAAKRSEGFSDDMIARMLKTPVARVRRNVVISEFDGRSARAADPDFGPPPTEAERQRRRDEAQRTRVWRPATA